MSMKLAVGLSFGLIGIAGFLVQAGRAYFSGDLELGKKNRNSRSGPQAHSSNPVFPDTDDKLQQFRQDDALLQNFYHNDDSTTYATFL